MKFLGNIKIGKKLAILLSANVLLLVALLGLALWGMQTIESHDSDARDRLIKARLAEKAAGRASSAGSIVDRMFLFKKDPEEDYAAVSVFHKEGVEAIREFRKLANTPKSIKHGADMEEELQAYFSSISQSLELLRAHRGTEGTKIVRDQAGPQFSRLWTTAAEAIAWQEQLVKEGDEKRAAASSSIWWSVVLGCLFSVLCSVVGGTVVSKNITTPMTAFANHLSQITKGDLSHDAPAEYLARGDEFGGMAHSKQDMIVSLRKMVHEITGGISVLSSASTELMTSSSQMTTGSRHASDRAHSVAAAAEEMSSNVTSVAAGMEQTTASLAHVSSATEQMTSTIGEIAANSEKARRITGDATRQAARITEQINQLGQAAREIGKVTETITEISSQTNLLALNATIEAARAGSAGKGFAVVANEIKALAQQTAAATEDIKARIGGVQSATASGVTEIEKVSHVIEEVSAIVNSIAAAIEEQATATKGIAQNIAQASSGVADANTRVAESSHVSREIAKDITSVDQTAGGMATDSDHVRASATELSTVAEQLKLTIGRFRV